MNEHWDDGEPVLDLRVIFARLWARRLLMAIFIVVFAGLFTVAALVMRPVYRATTMVISTSSEQNRLSGTLGSAISQVGGLAALVGVNVGGSDTAMEEALAVVSSRQFTEQFINDLNLMPKLFADKWDAAAGKWTGKVEEQPTIEKAFNYFDKSIREVTQDRRTGLITVQIDWRDRNEAAAWANELIKRVNAEMRSRAIDNAQASLEFLQKELHSTLLVETQGAINRLIEAQIQKRMLADVTDEYAFRVVDKAIPPDSDNPVRPKKLLMIVGGPVAGFAFGAFWVLFVLRVSASDSTKPKW